MKFRTYRIGRISLVAAACLSAWPVLAQDPSAPLILASSRQLAYRVVPRVPQLAPVQLADLLIKVAQQHPEVQAARAAAAGSKFEVDAAKAARYPRFAIGSTVTRTVSQSPGNPNPISDSALTATARITLLDAGAISARVRAAESGSRAQDAAFSSAAQKVLLDALTAYLQVQRFEMQRQIAESSIKVLDDLSKLELRRVELGAAGQNDARLAAARKASSGAKKIEYDVQLAGAMSRFQYYFGYRPDPRALPPLNVPANWVDANVNDALSRAFAANSQVREAQAQLDRAQALLEREKAARFPSFDAVVAKRYEFPGAFSDKARAGLEVNWQLGSIFDSAARINAAQSDVASKQSRLEAAKVDLAQQTESNWLRSAAERGREQFVFEAAEESFIAYAGRQRLASFGRETLISVLDAQVELYNQLIAAVDSLIDQRTSDLRLALGTGRLNLFNGADLQVTASLFSGADYRNRVMDILNKSSCTGGASTCGALPVLPTQKPASAPADSGLTLKLQSQIALAPAAR